MKDVIPNHLRPSVTALLLGNAVPLFGVLFLDWSLFSVMAIYWIETVVIGLFNMLKMARIDPLRAIPLSAFFVVHFGMFSLGHGLFVLVLFGGRENVPDFGLAIPRALMAEFRWEATALLLAHAFSFAFNFLGKREFESTPLAKQMMMPYGRVVVMHITIIASGFVLIGTRAHGGFVAVVVILIKTALDVFFHAREHKKRAAHAPPSEQRS